MRYYLLVILLSVLNIHSFAGGKDSVVVYNLPDSIKAFSLIAEFNIQSLNGKKEVYAGIRTESVQLSLESEKNNKKIVFEFSKSAFVMSNGIDVNRDDKNELEWNYDWQLNENYKLMLALNTDSAGNFQLYSAYVFLPKEMKWKLIGTCKINGRWNSFKNPAVVYSSNKRSTFRVITNSVWIQRTNFSWKQLDKNSSAQPVVNPMVNRDSISQAQLEIQTIENAISSGKTDAKEKIEGVYYAIMKPGDGKQVTLTDTVTVHYKGYLFSNGEIFDQTKEKPATFPLNRLIKGWQLTVPLLKVGGRIKIVIPSGQAYSIRPRAAKIPPNSILVFEVDVVDAKSVVN